jgi:hypothetical protein
MPLSMTFQFSLKLKSEEKLQPETVDDVLLMSQRGEISGG